MFARIVKFWNSLSAGVRATATIMGSILSFLFFLVSIHYIWWLYLAMICISIVGYFVYISVVSIRDWWELLRSDFEYEDMKRRERENQR